MDLCPACAKPSTYVEHLDSYAHLDGRNDAPCWLVITRGEESRAPDVHPGITTAHYPNSEFNKEKEMIDSGTPKYAASNCGVTRTVTARYGHPPIEIPFPDHAAATRFALHHTRTTGEPVEVHSGDGPPARYRRPWWREEEHA